MKLNFGDWWCQGKQLAAEDAEIFAWKPLPVSLYRFPMQ
jgi:hypothetical protein